MSTENLFPRDRPWTSLISTWGIWGRIQVCGKNGQNLAVRRLVAASWWSASTQTCKINSFWLPITWQCFLIPVLSWPGDIWFFFPKLKITMEGQHFEETEYIKTESQKLLYCQSYSSAHPFHLFSMFTCGSFYAEKDVSLVRKLLSSSIWA